VGDVAETAVPRAAGPQYQKGCCLAGKAFPEVGASGFLTNGVKPAFAQQSPYLFIGGSCGKPPF